MMDAVPAILIRLVLVGALISVLPAATARAADWTALDDAAHDAITAGEVPGTVILVGTGDRVLYRKAFGRRAVYPRAESMTIDTIFDVASLTKVVATTPAVLALWEEGRLDLDAPIGQYLTEFDSPRFQNVTVRRMLTHTAGFPDLPPAGLLAAGFPEAARLIAARDLTGWPGLDFVYSDIGFILLGEVVRRVSGQPLDRFTERRFFAPLGMGSTRFLPPTAWRTRIAPTEVLNTKILRGIVHDPNARLLDGVAGHAGLFSTADDLSRFCRMVLADGVLGKRRYLRASTVRTMFTPHPLGELARGLGWDMASPLSRVFGPFFPMGSLGHTGFTGTSIWMDPPSRTYVIVLSNRLHPNGRGSVVDLRRRVSAAIGASLFGGAPPPTGLDPLDDRRRPAGPHVPARAAGPTRTGLDRLVAENFARFAGRSLGLVTNQTGIDAQGRRAIDLLVAAPGTRLRAVFSPEHGIAGDVDSGVPHGRDVATGVPIWSLYGATRRPSPAMLTGIDTLVFDIQDVGVRYYTYLATLTYVMEEAARYRIPVVVLDRPNPITGRLVEGPLTDPDLRSFTAPHEIPVRTGMTIGEYARMAAAERRLGLDLTVVPLENWPRERWFDETGLTWVNPSPNIRSPGQALLYAGVGLLEATNVSVGRGTDMPFEVVGAPWIGDPDGLARALNMLDLPGVSVQPINFTPTGSVYAGQPLGGLRFVVTDRERFRPVRFGLALARELRERYPGHFRLAAIQNLLVNRATMWALLRGEPLVRIWSWAEAQRSSFLERRALYLIYPDLASDAPPPASGG
jgi:uncharacterized protein YbbC (DUF1343 family)/CubicO group peptidase (beta-lactamase class C family)